MYLRKIERHYKDRVYVHYLLVKSVHTSKGPRQRTVCSLGDLKPKPSSQWLDLFQNAVAALKKVSNGAAAQNHQGLPLGASADRR